MVSIADLSIASLSIAFSRTSPSRDAAFSSLSVIPNVLTTLDLRRLVHLSKSESSFFSLKISARESATFDWSVAAGSTINTAVRVVLGVIPTRLIASDICRVPEMKRSTSIPKDREIRRLDSYDFNALKVANNM